MATPSILTAPDAVAQLLSLTAGLLFLSESDAPLQVVNYAKPGTALPSAVLLTTLQEPADAPVQVVELNDFLRNHTTADTESAKRYQVLQDFLTQRLAAVHVYRVGSEPQIRAYALGTTADEQLAGFKTLLIET